MFLIQLATKKSDYLYNLIQIVADDLELEKERETTVLEVENLIADTLCCSNC